MSPRSVLVLGARGQLGVDLMAALAAAAVGADRPEAEITDADAIRAFVRTKRPEVVINCAAWTNVEQAEADATRTFEVNAAGALNVARAAAAADARLIYISTDYVFGADAQRRRPYVECDCPGPINVYGASKLAGEQLTLTACPQSLIIRTSGLYGHAGALGKRGNFVEKVLQRARTEKRLRVVSDQHTTPTSTAALAAAIAGLLPLRLRGLLHLASRDACSWHEFAQAIVARQRIDAEVIPIRAADYPTRARRPAFSVLESARDDLPERPLLSTWREMLERYLATRDDDRARG